MCVNVINCVILKIVSVEQKLVDKLVEECTENVEEVKPAKYTLVENENKHKCRYFTLHIVLFSIMFAINVGIGTYFLYYKNMNCDPKERFCFSNSNY